MTPLRQICPRLALVAAAGAGLASTVVAEEVPIELGPGDHVITAPGHYVDTDGDVMGTITLVSGDVVLDGLQFDGGGTKPAAVKNGVAGLHNVTIRNSTFTGYTGRTITYGFAEGVASNLDRGSNWAILENEIEQFGNSATAVALFNIDGVTVAANRVSFPDGASTGRRGFNLDGSSDVVVTGNFLHMGADPQAPCLAINATSPWAIQISMSDAAVSNIRIHDNEVTGSFYGVAGLSQRDITGLQVINNYFAVCRAVMLNTGGAAPLENLTFSDIKIIANSQDAIGTADVERFGVGLRDLHTSAPLSSGCCASGKKVTFENVKIHGNRSYGAERFLATWPDNPDMTYDLKETGNRLFD